jgi:hypothetical protein
MYIPYTKNIPTLSASHSVFILAVVEATIGGEVGTAITPSHHEMVMRWLFYFVSLH